jgi:hypothetical protein
MPKDPLRLFTVAFALILTLVMLGCPSKTNQPVNTVTPDASPGKSASDFDGDRAFEHVRKQVEFGPRPPGSPELEKTRGYIIEQLKSYGLNIILDEFQATTPIGQRKMVNVTAELPGESSDVIILASHYDSKYVKEFKFVGANDGGSSTGALMEMARVLAAQKQKPKFTYWFVFFDGEEAFCFDWDECSNPNPANPKEPLPDNTYGSRRYVANLIDKNEVKRVRAIILLDIVGYKDLQMGRADLCTRWLSDIVWQTGKQLGYGKQFVDRNESVGDDDHAAFLKAGIDALDIIQLSSYPHWHTKDDTLDKISARSLKMVGDTVLVSLPKIEERLASKPR